MSLEKEMDLAQAAVRVAIQICQGVRSGLSSSDTVTKSDASPVTVADFAAQAAINTFLHRAFPFDPIVGEEDSADLRAPGGTELLDRISRAIQPLLPELDTESIIEAIDRGGHGGGPEGRFWTLDPIDGTKGYIRGEQYAVALALIENGEVQLGVLGCPAMPASDGTAGCIFSAARGQGSRVTPLQGEAQAIRVQDLDGFERANFCESVESGHSAHGASKDIADRLGITAPPLRIDSQCKYGAVARGEATLYLRLPRDDRYREKIWDHAAGVILVEEAGGCVSDVNGKPLDFSRGQKLEDNRGVIVSNGVLHERVLSVVSEVLS
jgi:HAL2 family 3'(2'),5'-bisphosphate nucleotidase